MATFSVDYLDVVLTLLRDQLPLVRDPSDPDVTVMSRIPDHIDAFLPLVVIRRVGGDSPAPRFYDEPWLNTQCWCAPPTDPGTEIDAGRAAFNLADQVRRILWTALYEQQVVAGKGWITNVRESSAPQEIGDIDRPQLGRYTATYELRVRPVTA